MENGIFLYLACYKLIEVIPVWPCIYGSAISCQMFVICKKDMKLVCDVAKHSNILSFEQMCMFLFKVLPKTENFLQHF